jgi:hypothetical protein
MGSTGQYGGEDMTSPQPRLIHPSGTFSPGRREMEQDINLERDS